MDILKAHRVKLVLLFFLHDYSFDILSENTLPKIES